jgi:Protein required for attachment to host cells
MTPTSLIIVTDRGTLKAYKVNETPTRGPSLKLVQAFDTTDAHGRYQDKMTDQAGSFPSGAAPGQMNSIAERTGIETENDRRIVKQLADSIVEVVQREGRDGWSFAAPASIHSAVVDQLPPDVRDRIVEHVKSDLVKIELSKLPGHFRSLQKI